MNITKIQPNISFQNTQPQRKKHEFIDIIADNVRNPRDVQDCVAVPRGIFKAYIYLMLGSGLISIANFFTICYTLIGTKRNLTTQWIR